MTLTYKHDLDTFPLNLHAKIQVRTSVHSAVIARRRDTQTNDVRDVRCNYYNILATGIGKSRLRTEKNKRYRRAPFDGPQNFVQYFGALEKGALFLPQQR